MASIVAQARKPLDFFSLPLELRQMSYVEQYAKERCDIINNGSFETERNAVLAGPRTMDTTTLIFRTLSAV